MVFADALLRGEERRGVSGNNGTTSTSLVVAAMTFGFLLGITSSTITALGTYLWYYSSSSARTSDYDEEDKDGEDRRGSSDRRSRSSNNTLSSSSTKSLSVSFLSDIIQALWQPISTIAINKIQSNCQPIFDELSQTSLLLKNIHFTKIDLGHIPLRLDHVIVSDTCKVNPITQQKYIQIICDIIWDGQCNIQLKSTLGPFGIKAIKFRGTILIDCQPLDDTTTSIITAIQYSFLHPPTLHITDFTGIAQMADMQSIKTILQTSIIQSITDSMVLPNRTVMRMSSTIPVSFLDIYQPPIGVFRITLLQGYGFNSDNLLSATTRTDPLTTGTTTASPNATNTITPKGGDGDGFFSRRDIPDIYCTIQIGSSGDEAPWKSPIVHNSTHPIWKESTTGTTEALVYHLDQIVTLICYDSNTHVEENALGLIQSDTVLGTAHITVSELLYHKIHTIPLQQQQTVKKQQQGVSGCYSIQVQCDLYPFVLNISYLRPPPYQLDKTTTSTSQTMTTLNEKNLLQAPLDEPSSICGLLTVLISQAYDLPIDESNNYVGNNTTSSYVVISFGNLVKPLIAISTASSSGGGPRNPIYDSEFHIPITYEMMFTIQYNVQQLPSIIFNVMEGVPPKQITNDSTKKSTTYGAIEIPITQFLVQSSVDGIISGKQTLIGGRHISGGEQVTHNAKLEFLCALQGVAKTETTEDGVHNDLNKQNLFPTKSQFIKVTIIKGYGFQIEKRKLKLDDIPDIYCTIRLGSNPTIWTTSTIKNTTTPIWNESYTFFISQDMALSSILLYVNVYDSDSGALDADDVLGNIRIPLVNILTSPNETYDCEVKLHQSTTTTIAPTTTNAYITIQCEKVIKESS